MKNQLFRFSVRPHNFETSQFLNCQSIKGSQTDADKILDAIYRSDSKSRKNVTLSLFFVVVVVVVVDM